MMDSYSVKKIRILDSKKPICLKDLIEERKIYKNKDEKWILYFGVHYKKNFILTEDLIKIFLNQDLK